MGKYCLAACFLLGLCFLSPGAFPQEAAATIPDALRRPGRGEAPRYPRDMVIGELGRGEAPESAYRFAASLLDALLTGNKTAPVLAGSLSVLTDSLFEEVLGIEPRSFRLGGGKTEADGSVSFLVRFLGQAESIAGELYLRPEEAARAPESAVPESPEISESAEAGTAGQSPGEAGWILDDLALEEKRSLADIRDSYRYDFSPYERFF